MCTNQTGSECAILGGATVNAAVIEVEVEQNACNALGSFGELVRAELPGVEVRCGGIKFLRAARNVSVNVSVRDSG